MDNPLTVGTIVAIIPLTITFILYIIRLTRQFSQIEFKVNLLWDFQMRRGMVEAVNKGLATMNSPITFTDEVKSWYLPLYREMKEFYERTGKFQTDRELFIEVEARWGRRITEEVCIPHHLDRGACILAAIAVMKNGNGHPDSAQVHVP